ncbi:MAG TPA: VIT1/CCC1 transporter family protein [Mycobacteriales bacterium]|nr:VIT1/CCC1 transporter family protein [Mycobacteriales bacterium]
MAETAVARGAEIHHSHRDVNGGWLRPAVFGAMDGLVSNVALIAGVAAAAGRHSHVVVITGLAGLLAGAFSMAVGEWTSVHSQTELVKSEIVKEQRELVRNSVAEQRELAGLYRHRGLSAALAEQVAAEFSRNPELLWRIHVREELGVDPDNLPSPYVASGSSLVSFATGAFVPLAPYAFGASQLWISLALAAVALVFLGAAVARFTERPLWLGSVRQLGLGVAAAGITYGVGSLFGVGLS